MTAAVDTRALGADDLADLAGLFGSQRTTSHCWCMAFCASRAQFAAGWFGGGNRRRFEALAADDAPPMGVLARLDGQPIGWCACGPRARYTRTAGPGRTLLASHPPEAEEGAWLAPCLFVRAGFRGRGVSHGLLQAAVALSRRQGARAVEGWPLAESVTSTADAFVGREQVFSDLGFRRVDRLGPQRVLMRLDLDRD
jgi:GNAT superfamily N-acetyltransferase